MLNKISITQKIPKNKDKASKILFVSCYSSLQKDEFLDALQFERVDSVKCCPECDALIRKLPAREKKIAGLFFKLGAIYALQWCECWEGRIE